MIINQQQLNNIIDLLGSWLFALQLYQIKEKHKCHIESYNAEQSIADIQTAQDAYYQALAELYVDQDIPSVFKEPLNPISNGVTSINPRNFLEDEVISQMYVDFPISKITQKLNDDFNSTENIEQPANNLLIYTGTRYKSYQNDRISVGVQTSTKKQGNMSKTNFYFVMTVLSDPEMLLIAALCVPLICVYFTYGAVIPGVIFSAAAIGITSCYVAKRFGFFEENNGTAPSVTIEPYTLGPEQDCLTPG